jgi:protein-tyrosine phosphatase
MKSQLVFILMVLFQFKAQAGLVSPIPSTYLETGIPNSHLVSENIIRAMAPRNEKDLDRLIELGVEKFLIFKIDTNGDVEKQKNLLLTKGYVAKDILHLPFPWKDVTDYQYVCEMTVEALNFLKASDSKKQTTFMHCTVGEDRTGYLAGLYKIYSQQSNSAEEVFANELCDKGYEAGNPKKVFHVVQKVKESLTPAFFGMVDLIEKNRGKKLTKTMCKNFQAAKVNFKEFSCKKSKLFN